MTKTNSGAAREKKRIPWAAVPVEVKVENLLVLTELETASKAQWLYKHKPLKVRTRSLMDQLQAIKIRTNR